MPTIRRREYVLGTFTQQYTAILDEDTDHERYERDICHRRVIYTIDLDIDSRRVLDDSYRVETLDCCKAHRCSSWIPKPGSEISRFQWTKELEEAYSYVSGLARQGKDVPGWDDVEASYKIKEEELVLGNFVERFKSPKEVIHRQAVLIVKRDSRSEKRSFKMTGRALDCCLNRVCGNTMADYRLEDKELKDWSILPLKLVTRANEIIAGIEKPDNNNREPIPSDVRIYVWQRAGGKCVKCGSREKLEYDHIIPVSKGGSNTARNIELLCEKCNRSKGNSLV